jgi:hypothetical protein
MMRGDLIARVQQGDRDAAAALLEDARQRSDLTDVGAALDVLTGSTECAHLFELTTEPSSRRWWALCASAEQLATAHPEAFTRVVPWLEQALASWPAGVRTAPPRWCVRGTVGAIWQGLRSLARSLTWGEKHQLDPACLPPRLAMVSLLADPTGQLLRQIRQPLDLLVIGKRDRFIQAGRQALVATLDAAPPATQLVVRGGHPDIWSRLAPDNACLRQVRRLRIVGCSGTLDLRPLAARAPQLEQLRVHNAPGLEAVRHTTHLTKLRQLSFTRCGEVSTFDLAPGLPQLRHLDLYTCAPGGGDVTQLGPMPALKTLHLDARDLDDVSWLAQCPELRTLTLRCRTKRLVDVTACPSQQKLDIDGCPELERLTGLESLQALRQLRFEGCGRLRSLRPLRASPALRFERLDLRGLSFLESLEGLEDQDALHTLAVRVRPLLRSRALLSQLPALTSLSVAGRRVYGGRDADGIWRRAPDGTLGTLLPPLPSLETLRVTGTFLCSLDGLEHLPGLQALVIAGCRGIRVWDALRQAPASLTLLDCRDCEPYGYVRGQGRIEPYTRLPPSAWFRRHDGPIRSIARELLS